MAWYDFLTGSSDKVQQHSQYRPSQERALDALGGGTSQLSPQIFQYLQDLFSDNPEAAQRFGAPFMRQFNEQTVPGLAEQFAGAGGLSSSGFQNALGQASAGLSENLAALREGSRMQGLNAFQGLSGQTLGAKPFENIYLRGQPGLLGHAAQGLGQGIGDYGSGGIMKWLSRLLGGNKPGGF